MANKNESGSGAGAVAGFQIPMGLKAKKEGIDEVLRQNPDIGEGVALAYLGSLKEDEANQVGNMIDMGDHKGIADRMRMHAVRELVRKKVREVVRKKEGGGGYVLYAPNKGKKGKPKAVGTFPTKLGAKRAELARNPPKDPQVLGRLRKYVKRLTKKPNDDKAKAKKEGVIREAGSPFAPQSTSTPIAPTSGPQPGQGSAQQQVQQDPRKFFQQLQAMPKTGPDRGKFVQQHLADPTFVGNVQKMPNGSNALAQLNKFVNGSQNAGFQAGQTKTRAESVMREHMERTILSKIVTKSIVEAMFREEANESEWDDYISKLSRQALAGDTKFQNLQKNITRKTEGVLDDAFSAVRKALGKSAGVKNHGTHQEEGGSYLMFSAEVGGEQVGPIAIAIEGGKPKIHLSPEAKQALLQVDPNEAKMFRAELISVQEAILDEIDDLSKATQARDKYLEKLEGNVDAYVSGLSPLEISVLKNLLTKKYRKLQ